MDSQICFSFIINRFIAFDVWVGVFVCVDLRAADIRIKIKNNYPSIVGTFSYGDAIFIQKRLKHHITNCDNTS